MSSKDIVLSFIASINQNDVAAMGNQMCEHHIFVDSVGDVISGRADVLAAWDNYFLMFPEYHLRVEHILEDGPMVAVFGTTDGTFAGVGAAGFVRHIVIHAAWKVVISDGMIGSWQVYADWSRGMALMQDSDEQALEGGTLLKT